MDSDIVNNSDKVIKLKLKSGYAVFIEPGESLKEAIIRQQGGESAKSKPRDIKDMLPNNYREQDEYKQHWDAYTKSYNKVQQLDKQMTDIDTEMKEHWIVDNPDADEIDKLLGLDGHYDEAGATLKQQYNALRDERTEYNRQAQNFRNKAEEIDHFYARYEASMYKDPPLQKASQTNYPGFANNTTNAWLDEQVAKGRAQLVEMSPKEYMERISYHVFGSSMQSTMESAYEPTVKKYAAEMKQGDKFPIGYIDYARKEQEGRHRALAAYLNGYEKIPVYIIK